MSILYFIGLSVKISIKLCFYPKNLFYLSPFGSSLFAKVLFVRLYTHEYVRFSRVDNPLGCRSVHETQPTYKVHLLYKLLQSIILVQLCFVYSWVCLIMQGISKYAYVSRLLIIT